MSEIYGWFLFMVAVFGLKAAMVLLARTKKTRTEQLRDVVGRYASQGYKFQFTYDGRWI